MMKLELALQRCRFATQWTRPLEMLAAALLACSGILKIVSAFQRDALLAVPDPVLAIQTGHLFLEVGMASVLALPGSSNRKLLLITAFSLSVTFYRMVGVVGGARFLPCPCLGHGFSRWPAFNARIPMLSAVLYFTLLIANAGLAVSFMARRQGRTRAPGGTQATRQINIETI